MSTQSMRRLSLGALAVALCAAGPVAAQTTFLNEHTVTVQNNHHRALKVYLQEKDRPVDMTLGTVEGMQIATFPIPAWAVEDATLVAVRVQADGGVPLEGDALVSERGPHFGMMVGHTGRVVENESKMWASFAPFDENTTTVTVRNEDKHATKVFIQSGSTNQRLGEVPAYSEMTFQVPEGFVDRKGQLEFVSEKGGVQSSAALDLEQGRHLGVRID